MFNTRSQRRLSFVLPHLNQAATRARNIYDTRYPDGFDWQISEGLRDQARQNELVAIGASKTTDSRHITGHAIDVAMFDKNGTYIKTVTEDDYCRIAECMKAAAKEYAIAIVWGAVWDRDIRDLRPPFMAEIEAYKKRREEAGKKAFIDGVHFELSKREYP